VKQEYNNAIYDECDIKLIQKMYGTETTSESKKIALVK